MDLFSKRSTATTIAELHKEWEACQACPFYAQRQNIVFGIGNVGATIFAVGQAPADKEDETGTPYTGRGGIVTKNEFNKVGIPEKDVWWTNVLACRPFGWSNDIRRAWMENCWDRLEGEMIIVKPKMIVAMGAPAARRFLPAGAKGEMRGRDFIYRGLPGLTVLHPAARARAAHVRRRQGGDIDKDLDIDMQRIRDLYDKMLGAVS